jgi:hypothetical protein
MYKLLKASLFIFLLFPGLGYSEEGQPIQFFQIDFDLSYESVLELGSSRFDCVMSRSKINEGGHLLEGRAHFCILNGTYYFLIENEGKNLKSLHLFCPAFNGCGYKHSKLAKAVGEQKNLDFNEYLSPMDLLNPTLLETNFNDAEIVCAVADLGETICVYDRGYGPSILMNRHKFRAKTLSFE